MDIFLQRVLGWLNSNVLILYSQKRLCQASSKALCLMKRKVHIREAQEVCMETRPYLSEKQNEGESAFRGVGQREIPRRDAVFP